MNTIIIDYRPFALYSYATIIKKDEEIKYLTISSNINDLGMELTCLTVKNDIYHVKFKGPHEVAKKLRETAKYANNRLEIEEI